MERIKRDELVRRLIKLAEDITGNLIAVEVPWSIVEDDRWVRSWSEFGQVEIDGDKQVVRIWVDTNDIATFAEILKARLGEENFKKVIFI